jgi:glycosyltransferase involved in cell wall biosynthesis
MVCVLLSTFNGEPFLRELMESLLLQEYEPIEIVVRDDGSTDNTPQILREYGEKSKEIHLRYGENVGVVRSFFDLLEKTPENARFVAFCDQDDVWKPDKIGRAVKMLEGKGDHPAMYFHRLSIVDADLGRPSLSRIPRRVPSLGNALLENIVSGCTIVLNRPALHLIRENLPDPNRIFMHDWWIYQVMAALGEILYDPSCSILHRQHSRNCVGQTFGAEAWKRRWNGFMANKNGRKFSNQASELRRVFGSRLSGEKSALIEEFLKAMSSTRIIDRIRFAAACRIHRQGRIDDLIFRLLMVSGKL